ncbi:MAG: hypothetical protein WCR33_01890 [Bacilli bacterium]
MDFKITEYTCPICGETKVQTDVCPNCNNCIPAALQDQTSLEYYMYNFKINIINHDMDKILTNAALINKLNPCILSTYYLNLSNNKAANYLKTIKITKVDDNIRLLFRTMINYNELKVSKKEYNDLFDEIIEDKKFKNECKRAIENLQTESAKLINQVIELPINTSCHRQTTKRGNIVGLLAITGLACALLLALLTNLLFDIQFKYSIITIVMTIPSIFFTIALSKYIDSKNLFVNILMFLVIFYIVSYIFTISFRSTSFIETFYVHSKEIINAIPELLDNLNKTFEEVAI